MTRDDANTLDRTGTDGVPAPRTDREALWPERGHVTRSTRPRSEYWDVANARWARRSPLPAPRRGE